MKLVFTVLMLVVATLASIAQKSNPNYDSTLARKVGADDYGMKNYVLVILKTGENKSTDKAFKDSCFAGHMKNINRLVDEQKLVVAGPFGKNDKQFRGLFILSVPTVEEAQKLVDTDPAVKAGFLAAEFVPWYGSAALSEYLPASDKVWKKGF
jgi:uncharacterized protein YciI